MNVIKDKNVNQIPSWQCKLEEIKSIYINSIELILSV